ncbi:hypothetical protein BD410DRAFT_825736 [Rickenella mellea]|uniref:Uncharacterized protein n=1 Tax=Rickenella mellea TaxID=50990 RepID=A0A4Y7QG28_9AGAM|nr:hypothetical protein BD410DRAFT_825736 [Rickenella mellea]
MPKVVKSPFKSRVEVVITKRPPGQRSLQSKAVGNTSTHSQQAQGSAEVKRPRRVILIVRPPRPDEPVSPSTPSPTVKRIKLIVSTSDASIRITTSPQASTPSATASSSKSTTIHTAQTSAPPPEEELPAPKATPIISDQAPVPQPSQSNDDYDDDLGSDPEFLYPNWTPPPIQPSTAWLHWAAATVTYTCC